jgi:hypothetical protein
VEIGDLQPLLDRDRLDLVEALGEHDQLLAPQRPAHLAHRRHDAVPAGEATDVRCDRAQPHERAT